MRRFPMPNKPPFDDGAYHFNGVTVRLMFTEGEYQRLDPTDHYICLTACVSAIPANPEEQSFLFAADEWPEVVRLIAMGERDPMQAIFETWLQFDESNDVPQVAKDLNAGRDETTGLRWWNPATVREFWPLKSRVDSAHRFPAPSHGPEGSDV